MYSAVTANLSSEMYRITHLLRSLFWAFEADVHERSTPGTFQRIRCLIRDHEPSDMLGEKALEA